MSWLRAPWITERARLNRPSASCSCWSISRRARRVNSPTRCAFSAPVRTARPTVAHLLFQALDLPGQSSRPARPKFATCPASRVCSCPYCPANCRSLLDLRGPLFLLLRVLLGQLAVLVRQPLFELGHRSPAVAPRPRRSPAPTAPLADGRRPARPGRWRSLLHGLRLGDRRRRPATVLQILPRAAVDVRLPAQLSRPLKVALAVGRVAPIGQAAAVDPFGPARLLQRPIRRLLPRLAGRVQPIPGLGRPALARPATLRGRGVVPLEPLLLAARDPVIAALRDRQEAIL